jgi:hypothetical protein
MHVQGCTLVSYSFCANIDGCQMLCRKEKDEPKQADATVVDPATRMFWRNVEARMPMQDRGVVPPLGKRPVSWDLPDGVATGVPDLAYSFARACPGTTLGMTW